MIKLVVFDLGETLVNYKGLSLNWSSHYEKSIMYACDGSSINYDDKKIADASSILLKYNTRVNPRIEEVSAHLIFGEIIAALNCEADKTDSVIKKFFEYFQRETVVEETAVELLTYLKNINVKRGVLTDVPYGMPKELVLKDLQLIEDLIDIVVTSEEIGFRKPETIGLKKILDHFNLKIDESVYVGNERKDIETANNLGVYSVLLNNEEEIPKWGQKKTVAKLVEIKSLFDSDLNNAM